MNTYKLFKWIGIGVGSLFGIWSLACLISATIAVGGVFPLIGSWMMAAGMIGPIATLGEYYIYVKGIEYLICVGFFVAFPLFYRYINTLDVQDAKKVTKECKKVTVTS